MFAMRRKLGESLQYSCVAKSLLSRRYGELFHVEATLAGCGRGCNRSTLWNWHEAAKEVKLVRESVIR